MQGSYIILFNTFIWVQHLRRPRGAGQLRLSSSFRHGDHPPQHCSSLHWHPLNLALALFNAERAAPRSHTAPRLFPGHPDPR
ncbi:hypothetical protein OF83DRAFT_1139720 [Amylostereum chailletii]|nr:hypothetical protein OF83DRAFT_1139720 [Amylostereum chailletii]